MLNLNDDGWTLIEHDINIEAHNHAKADRVIEVKSENKLPMYKIKQS